MDPQQRLLLEHGYAALHGARLPRMELLGSNAGVYLGYSSNDFAAFLASSPLGKSVYSATGSAGPIASGRLSYVLGLQGPCAMIDTACSAGLVATSFARGALVLRECELAAVMAVNLILSPDGAHTPFAIAGMTSPHGKCHTFDTRADGYPRAEACGATVLRTTGHQGQALLRHQARCIGPGVTGHAAEGAACPAI